MDLDLLFLEEEISSYNELANYLCRKVFTDMSVLPLVFPSNISCFSRGSYKEELARKRELPVPPEPRRSGILARSDDNLAGNYENLLSSLSFSVTDTCSTLTRHSSYTWLHDEEEDTCLLASQLRRRYEEVRKSAMEQSGTSFMEQEEIDDQLQPEQIEEQCFQQHPTLSTPSIAPISVEIVSHHRTQEEITDALSDAGDENVINDENSSDVTINQISDTMNEKEETKDDELIDKMSVFKKKEKTSLFQRTIDRLSFKSRKKKDKDKTYTVEVLPLNTTSDIVTSPTITIDHEIRKLEESPKISPRFVTPSKSPPTSLILTPASMPSPAPVLSTPTSAKYRQSRPINQLDQALKNFKRDTAKSRENLSLSRPDLTEAISVFTSKPNTPRVELKSFNKTPGKQNNSSAPPPAASSRWRQVAPSSNKYVESEWAKLSASMVNLSKAGKGNDVSNGWRETNLSSSNMSLDIRETDINADRGVRLDRMDRAMSVNVLSALDNKDQIKNKIPDNQLQDMNSYQKRIQASMEKLNVPSWYKTSNNNVTAPSTPILRAPSSSSTLPSFSSSWRTASLVTPVGWRRQNPPVSSTLTSPASTLERQSCLVTSQRFRTKGATLPSSSSSHNLLPSKLYLGWRSQERLDIGPVYLTSPAQRLATSAVVVKPNTKEDSKTTETVMDDIKEVTDAIIDYCSSPVDGKPVVVKQGWMKSADDDSDQSDNPDDDSGIDRSDDFTQEILNEA